MFIMKKELVKLANHLDRIGRVKEANYVDALIKRYAQGASEKKPFDPCNINHWENLFLSDGIAIPFMRYYLAVAKANNAWMDGPDPGDQRGLSRYPTDGSKIMDFVFKADRERWKEDGGHLYENEKCSLTLDHPDISSGLLYTLSYRQDDDPDFKAKYEPAIKAARKDFESAMNSKGFQFSDDLGWIKK